MHDPNQRLRTLTDLRTRLATTSPVEPAPVTVLRPPIGAVVWWSTARSCGHGQIASYREDGFVHVRPWLPTRSHTVTVDPSRLRVRCTLDALLTALCGGEGGSKVQEQDLGAPRLSDNPPPPKVSGTPAPGVVVGPARQDRAGA